MLSHGIVPLWKAKGCRRAGRPWFVRGGTRSYVWPSGFDEEVRRIPATPAGGESSLVAPVADESGKETALDLLGREDRRGR